MDCEDGPQQKCAFRSSGAARDLRLVVLCGWQSFLGETEMHCRSAGLLAFDKGAAGCPDLDHDCSVSWMTVFENYFYKDRPILTTSLPFLAHPVPVSTVLIPTCKG